MNKFIPYVGYDPTEEELPHESEAYPEVYDDKYRYNLSVRKLNVHINRIIGWNIKKGKNKCVMVK